MKLFANEYTNYLERREDKICVRARWYGFMHGAIVRCITENTTFIIFIKTCRTLTNTSECKLLGKEKRYNFYYK